MFRIVFIVLLAQATKVWPISSKFIIKNSRLISPRNMNIPDTVLEKFKDNNDIAAQFTVPPNEITNNPEKVSNAMMKILCEANIPGNYLNPFNCHQYIMCDTDGSTYLWECNTGGPYDPYADECVYPQEPDAEQCPWTSPWTGTEPATCETHGQRPFWSYLTFPKNPQEKCGADLTYCHQFETVYVSQVWPYQPLPEKCPEGYGFSKILLACFPTSLCLSIDAIFGL